MTAAKTLLIGLLALGLAIAASSTASARPSYNYGIVIGGLLYPSQYFALTNPGVYYGHPAFSFGFSGH